MTTDRPSQIQTPRRDCDSLPGGAVEPPRQLIAEVISIGDEMTSGARLDTNSQWISQRLGDLGVEVAFHSTVGDTLSHNVDVFRIAANRADVVVASGGLGPTRDDLTREALALAVDQPLELNESALAHIEALFSKRGREMPDRNRLQAMFPRGSQTIFNPQGTAPGVDLPFARPSQPDSRVFALPGVPAEMKQMFDATVADRILSMGGSSQCIVSDVMKFFGTGESDMEQRLGPMIARDRQPRVGITVSEATISLRISATAVDKATCQAMIDQTRQEILQRVGELHFADGEHVEQFHVVDEVLKNRQQSVAVIELGNAAPLGDWFASLGTTTAYRGGVSVNASQDLAAITGQGELSLALANLKTFVGSDWVLMVDGYPALNHTSDAPAEASEISFMLMTPAGQIVTQTISMGGHPSILQQRIAKSALQWFRQVLASTDDDGHTIDT